MNTFQHNEIYNIRTLQQRLTSWSLLQLLFRLCQSYVQLATVILRSCNPVGLHYIHVSVILSSLCMN